MFKRCIAVLCSVFLFAGCAKTTQVMFNDRGVAHQKSGKYDQAIADYGKAVAINLALADYDKALRIDPRNYRIFLNKALACDESGRVKDAAEAYRNVLKYAPSKESYYGYVLQRVKEIEKTN